MADDHANLGSRLSSEQLEEFRRRLQQIQERSLPSPPDLESIRSTLSSHAGLIVGNAADPDAGVGALDELIDSRVEVIGGEWESVAGERHNKIMSDLDRLKRELVAFAQHYERLADQARRRLQNVWIGAAVAHAQIHDIDRHKVDLPPRETSGQVRPERLHGGAIAEEIQAGGGRWWRNILFYLILVLAIGVDVAAFFQVFALAMRDVPEIVVWLGAAGFTVVALGLAHLIGNQLRRHIRRRRLRPWTSVAAWVLTSAWGAVGAVAFIIRVTARPVSGGDATEISEEGVSQTVIFGPSNALPALFFLALFVATGVLTAFVTYRHSPTGEYRRLLEQGDVLEQRVELHDDLCTDANGLVAATQEEETRRKSAWEKAHKDLKAHAAELKAWANHVSRSPRTRP